MKKSLQCRICCQKFAKNRSYHKQGCFQLIQTTASKMAVFANGGVLARLKIRHFQGFTVLQKESDVGIGEYSFSFFSSTFYCVTELNYIIKFCAAIQPLCKIINHKIAPLNPILHGINPHVVSMLDFCAHLAWPHFFSRIPRNFLMVSKRLHIRALSKCCKVSSCLASLCFKNDEQFP